MARAPETHWLVGRPGGVRQTLWRVLSGTFDAEEVLARGRPGAVAVPEDGWLDVLADDELGVGRVVEVSAGDRLVAVARTSTGLAAVQGLCPHANGPLGEGSVTGNLLTCPSHGWTFDLTTGACLTDPSQSLVIFGVREQGGRVQVRVEGPGR